MIPAAAPLPMAIINWLTDQFNPDCIKAFSKVVVRLRLAARRCSRLSGLGGSSRMLLSSSRRGLPSRVRRMPVTCFLRCDSRKCSPAAVATSAMARMQKNRKNSKGGIDCPYTMSTKV